MNDKNDTEYRREIAKMRLASAFEDNRLAWKATHDFAQLCIRLLSFTHGGALIGMLTFIGHYPDLITARTPLLTALVFFSLGLFLTLVTAVLGYIAQQIFTFQEAAGAEKHVADAQGEDGANNEDAEHNYYNLGRRFQVAATLVGIVAGLLFILGVGAAVVALLNSAPR